jgi:hypothetical protein
VYILTVSRHTQGRVRCALCFRSVPEAKPMLAEDGSTLWTERSRDNPIWQGSVSRLKDEPVGPSERMK